MAGELILIVEDEENIVELARLYLEREGYRVEAVGDGNSALEAIERLQPALVLLDLMLPGLDGLEVCRRLRAEGNFVPILMVTAKDDDIDTVLGLELGADDYLAKPFNPRVLVARARAILRRGEVQLGPKEVPIHVGDLVIDPARRTVTVKGEEVDLRHQEFNLLLTMVKHKSLVLSRERLLNLAWGYDYAGETRTVDVHVGHLRKKLECSSVVIETITNAGYKLID